MVFRRLRQEDGGEKKVGVLTKGQDEASWGRCNCSVPGLYQYQCPGDDTAL